MKLHSILTKTILFICAFAFHSAYGKIAILDISGSNFENEESEKYSQDIYSATYLCDIAGYNYFVTNSLESAMNQKLILLATPISETSWSYENLSSLSEWIREGGTLLAPGIQSMPKDANDIVAEIFGIDATKQISTKSTRTIINWNPDHYGDRELEYIDEDNERATSIGKVGSMSFTPATCELIATFANGDAAVARHRHGKGNAYLACIHWKDVVQRNQVNKDKSASRQYNNGFEPSSDVWAFFLRSIYANHNGPTVWKFTIPAGYTQLLIPTHDCDSRTAYDEMHFMSEYEKSLGLSGHYFLTTHYYSDKVNFGYSYLSDFYNSETLPKAQQLLEDGHTVGSHSICHFPDFNKTRNTDVVTRDEYAHRATCVDGTSTGASTWAEIVLSKQILEEDLGNNVRSFRSGHLCVNPDFHAMLEEGDYCFQSCYTAGDLLSEFPFFGCINNDWNNELTNVLTMPLHMSDVYNNKDGEPLNNDTWATHRAPDEWESAMQKLRGNYAAAILLIHPNREWKMTLQKKLIERLDSTEVGLYNFEEYGDFWLSRLNNRYTYTYESEDGHLIITTDTEELMKSKMTFGIEVTDQPVNYVTISNEDATETYTATLKRLTDTRYLAIPDFPDDNNAVEEITDNYKLHNGKGTIFDINGRFITTFSTSEGLKSILSVLKKGLYIIKEATSTQKVII